MTKQHTPTPWQTTAIIIPYITVSDGTVVAEVHATHSLPAAEAEANRQFIVRAVNSHDALVKALKAVLVAIDCNKGQGGNLENKIDRENPLTVQTLRAALAKAEGRE